MNRTLILYDGKQSSAERSAERLCYVVGSAKAVEIEEAPEDLAAYAGVCFVFQFYGAVTTGKVRNYLSENREKLLGKRLAAVGVGYSDLGYTKYIVDMEKEVGIDDIASYFLSSNTQTTRAGYEIGRLMRAPRRAMDEEKLMDAIRRFVEAHSALALATATDGYIRCTPLEYTFIDDCFYIATEGGNKFRGIIENGRVSAAIYDAEKGIKASASLQLLGEAEIVPVGSAEYQVAMTAKHITAERLQKLPVTLFLIRLTPLRYDFTNPAFRQEGFDAAQALTTSREKKKRKEGQERLIRERAKGQPTYTVIGENGEKKQVVIPEVSTNTIPGFLGIPEEKFSLRAGNRDTEEKKQRAGTRAAADEDLLIGNRAKEEKSFFTGSRAKEEKSVFTGSRAKEDKGFFTGNRAEEEKRLRAENRDTEEALYEERLSEEEEPETSLVEEKRRDTGGRRKKEAKRKTNLFSRITTGIGSALKLEDEEEDFEEEEL